MGAVFSLVAYLGAFFLLLLLLATSAILGILKAVLLLSLDSIEEAERRRILLDQVNRHRDIADFTAFGADSLEDRLQLRAKPNARLVRAFDLNNSFTTATEDVHRRFLRGAKAAIQPHGADDWKRFSAATKEILSSCVKYFDHELPNLPLARVVRIVSFSVVLRILFGIEPSKIDVGDAQVATEAINRLWAQSKECGSEPSQGDKNLLDGVLRKLLPQHYHPPNTSTEANPLNLIMPAYETLWRVVLLTFVSVAGPGVDPRTSWELQKAIRNVPECLNRNDDTEKHTLAIAKEGLRLYPPTRRIHRATSTIEGEGIIVAADVEACHRYPEIWGPDAHRFLPTRFHGWPRSRTAATTTGNNEKGPRNRQTGEEESVWTWTSEQIHSYFPFGVGKHACPAGSGFGERIITLLVVELARRFGTWETTGLAIHFGDASWSRTEGHLLPTGRYDMESWVLELGNRGRNT